MNMYELGETFRLLESLAEAAEAGGSADQAAVIADALGQIGGDITEKLDSCAALITEWKHRADAMATEAKRLSDARAALVRRGDRLKACMMQLMESTDTKKAQGKRFTIGQRKGSMSVLIDTAAELPDEYMRHPDPVPDKTAIKAALDSGETVYGATLHRGPTTVTIK